MPSLTGPRITINLNTINTLITTVLLSDEFICTPVTNNRTRAHLISSHSAHTPHHYPLICFHSANESFRQSGRGRLSVIAASGVPLQRIQLYTKLLETESSDAEN